MKRHQWQLTYIKWFSAEEIYDAIKTSLSELSFAQDEQRFFEAILFQFSSKIEKKIIAKRLFQDLENLKKEGELLVSASVTHRNDLKILIDGINQIDEEKAYKKVYTELIDAIDEFQIKHRQFKKDLFGIVSELLKIKNV